VKDASDMDALSALGVVQATLAASGFVERASALVAAIAALPTSSLQAVACFRLDDSGHSLLPVASWGAALQQLPQIGMDDLQHPATYCLVQGRACMVSDALASVDGDLAGLAGLMKRSAALLAFPLRDRQRQRALGVLLLAGSADELRRVQASLEWPALLGVVQRLLGQASRQGCAPTRSVRASAPVLAESAARCVGDGLIGTSVVARRLRAEVLAAAESRLSVLITGETGTGKDHAAWLIHRSSPRSEKAFVPLNCAAVAPELIAAELFGAAKGAYTGADRARQGLVAAADGGTLFLDEIGDMPLPLQATLLRLLNERRYRPLGEVEEKHSDFRLICATHQPLAEMVHDGRFREDLYFRIRQLTLALPPLRERRIDIPLLAAHAIACHNREHHTAVTGLSADASAALLKHPFPGNIRELLTLMQVACERARNAELIELGMLHGLLADPPGDAMPPAHDTTDHLPLNRACEAFERRVIVQRLRHFDGSRTRTANSLGIARRTLIYKCKRFGLEESP
jgi:sigma-54-specific transcriptional regulator